MEGITQIAITMACYMLVVIGIGLFFAKRSHSTTEEFFLGGRSLGPWVTAMSAEASDMSGWLLMGLPGVAYWCGIADASWTAIGLVLGTYINWLLVAKRLRKYSETCNNSITIPEFFSNRFHEKNKVILILSAIFIVTFFVVYTASGFVACGKLFSTLFGKSYHSMLILGAVFVLLYTLIGGFLAESASDFMQALVMVVALVTVFVLGVSASGGFGEVLERAKEIPGYLSLKTMANPQTEEGIQVIQNGVPQFGEPKNYNILTVLSNLAWGIGYFGMPQVLLRFMAIRDAQQLSRSRRIATVWVIISLTAAVLIGVIGRNLYPVNEKLISATGAENVFIVMATDLLPGILAGLVLAGILAATISSSDSYMLIAASACSKNLIDGIAQHKTGKSIDDKTLMHISRVTLLVISLVAIYIAWNENSVIFTIVSFAWAGFGATFGPLMLFSLFWRRINRSGAIAGMVSGAVTVFVWKLLIKPLGGPFGIYELLPAAIISSLAIVVVSLVTAPPDEEICKEFDSI